MDHIVYRLVLTVSIPLAVTFLVLGFFQESGAFRVSSLLLLVGIFLTAMSTVTMYAWIKKMLRE